MTHRSFNILSSQQNLEGHRLLEASAGTGKTFAIENYVVRALLESSLTIDQVLVLTFTNAAANDLKSRIRECLETTDRWLRSVDPLSGTSLPPDYLISLLKQNDDKLRLAQQKIRLSLYSFENASIYTLHAFCQKVLAEQGLLDASQSIMPKAEVYRCILDFIRTELDPEWIHPSELKILWKKEETEEIIKQIEKEISKGTTIAELPSFRTVFKEFFDLYQTLGISISAEKVIEDYHALAPSFKYTNNKLKDTYGLALLLEQGPAEENYVKWIYEDYEWTKSFLPANLKKGDSADFSKLHYPHLHSWICEKLVPFVQAHQSIDSIRLRLAGGAQKMLRSYMAKERRFSYDEMLRQMGDAVKEVALGDALRKKYRLAIVDEFQDTDPIQWRILKRLFLTEEHPWDGRLVLVGDPKQSIYAFRQADIYTYLDASEALGEDAFASLDTNYRSHPKLIAALNTLFDQQRLPNLIYLPKSQKSIDCPPVNAGLNPEKLQLLPLNEIGVDVVAAAKKEKDETVFHFIANEILRLHTTHHVPFDAFAVLIKSHVQGQKLADTLREHNIPCTQQKGRSLLQSPAFGALKELLTAILYSRDVKLIKVALGGKILGWSYKQVLELEDPHKLALVLQQFAEWHQLLQTAGFAACFQHILDESGYGELLLKRENGAEFFSHLLQTAELLLEKQGPHHMTADEVLDLFNALEAQEANDESTVAAKSTTTTGVTLITIHSSKGLEYSIVFALGVADKSDKAEPVVVQHLPEERVLKPVSLDSEEYKLQCEEIDAEKMRQLYVAATRAKYKLYLFVNEEDKLPAASKASHMQLYLKPSLGEMQSLEKIKSYFSQLDAGSGNIRFQVITANNHFLKAEEQASGFAPDKFRPIPKVHFPFQPSHIASFTTISSHSSANHLGLPAPQDYQATLMNPHTLPAGAETGTLLHTVFEKLDFNVVNSLPDLEKAITPFLVGHALEPWHQTLTRIVHSTLTTSLGSFRLIDIDLNKCYREAEFLYSAQSPEWMKGVIDLFFSHNGKYYLLDWKSNWLGPDESYYTYEHLQQAMHDNQYFLQAKIYCEALRRYLSLVDSRPFDECFGGVYYLFVRGLPSGQGIFHAPVC